MYRNAILKIHLSLQKLKFSLLALQRHNEKKSVSVFTIFVRDFLLACRSCIHVSVVWSFSGGALNVTALAPFLAPCLDRSSFCNSLWISHGVVISSLVPSFVTANSGIWRSNGRSCISLASRDHLSVVVQGCECSLASYSCRSRVFGECFSTRYWSMWSMTQFFFFVVRYTLIWHKALVWLQMNAGWIVSVCLFAAFFGCAVSGVVADSIGRRRSFQLSTIPMILGACARFVACSHAVFQVNCNNRLQSDKTPFTCALECGCWQH